MPAPASAQLFGGDNGDAQRRQAELSLRVNQLEGQLRQMNGQIEQMGFQIKQLNDLVVRMQKDFEFRLQDLEGAGAARKPAPQRKSEAPIAPPQQDLQVGAAPLEVQGRPGVAAIGQQQQIGAPMRSGPGAPPQVLGQISGNDAIGGVIGGNQPLDLTQGGGRKSTVVVNADEDDDEVVAAPPGVRLGPQANVTPSRAVAVAPPQRMAVPAPQQQGQPVPPAADEYDAAYGYILNGEYALAETSFRAFLQDHPTDRRAASGQYWLGETYYSRKLYREAADAFLTSYQQYPTSPKAPDSLLKLGLSLGGLGEKKAACASFDELLAKYPKASKALRDLATSEKARAKCA